MHGRISRRFVGLSFMAFALSAAPVLAGTDTWTIVGQPEGGPVNVVVVDPVTPTTVYAGTDTGIFRSTDSGGHWSRLLAVPNFVSDIVIQLSDPDTLYAVFTGDTPGQIHKSTDGGATWTSINQGFDTTDPMLEVLSVALDPTDPQVAYATGNGIGVYKTTDGGQHWRDRSTGLPMNPIGAVNFLGKVIVDPVDHQVLYAPVLIGATLPASVYKSLDGGAHWAQTTLAATPQSMTMDPSDHTHLFVASGSGVYESVDSGATWNLIAGSPTGTATVTVDPSDAQHIFVGTYGSGMSETTDGGAHWTVVNGSDPSVGIEDVAIDPVTPAHVYATTSREGLLKSEDGGTTWAPANRGLHGVQAWKMLAGVDGDIYLGTTDAGIYKSSDHGVYWRPVNRGLATGFNDLFILGLAQDPVAPNRLYVATGNGLYKTTDRGEHWNLLSNGLTDPFTEAVVIDPLDHKTLFAGTASAGVFKTTDGGMSWTPVNHGFGSAVGTAIWSLAIDPTDDQRVFAGTQGEGLYRSTDGGASWKADNDGMPVGQVHAIVIHHGVVYLSIDSHGIYKSEDGGDSWVSASGGLPKHNSFNAIVADPSDPATLYLPSFSKTKSYVTRDSGATWAPLTGASPGAPYPVAFGAMAFDPGKPGDLYASGSDGRVYVADTSQVTPPPPPPPPPPPTAHESSGGGGSFPLIMGFLLLGLGVLRRRR